MGDLEMKYNFDEIIDRKGTNAMKAEGFRQYIFHAGPEKTFPFADDEFVHMWVADMELATPPEICQAIKDRVDRRIFGYSMVFDPGYYEAFSKWCKDRYDWSFPKEELVFSPGIIPALYQIVECRVPKDKKVLMQTPAYGYFAHSCEYNDVEIVKNDLTEKNGVFDMDWERFEEQAADPDVALIMFCNPHNPSGRMWTAEELKRVADTAEKYDKWLISDEIHCDLLRVGKKHIPMGKVTDYGKLITCMSASKTFNMAGLMMSDIIIRDADLRAEFLARDKICNFVNPISVEAHKAAYEKCGEWLDELKVYLDDNFKLVQNWVDENLPEAEFTIPDATYLAWVNLGPCLEGVDDMCDFFANKAGVLLEGGNDLFVGNAEGWVRLNLACPRAMLQKGLDRMLEAIREYNK